MKIVVNLPCARPRCVHHLNYHHRPQFACHKKVEENVINHGTTFKVADSHQRWRACSDASPHRWARKAFGKLKKEKEHRKKVILSLSHPFNAERDSVTISIALSVAPPLPIPPDAIAGSSTAMIFVCPECERANSMENYKCQIVEANDVKEETKRKHTARMVRSSSHE